MHEGLEPDFVPKLTLYNPGIDLNWLPDKKMWRFKNSDLTKKLTSTSRYGIFV